MSASDQPVLPVLTSHTLKEFEESGLPNDFPPEILSRVLHHLSYKDLLTVLSVAKKWKAIVDGDPALGVQMFKRASQGYVEAGDGSCGDDTAPDSEKLRMHPVLSLISFTLRDAVSETLIFTRKNGVLEETKLADSAVMNDLATIPAVQTFTIKIEEGLNELISAEVEVKNNTGIRIIDIFTELTEAGKRIVVTEEEGPLPLHEALGDHVFYEGWMMLKRTGTALSAYLDLGS
ncbi:hypothetical protein C8R44DRAFT_198286 [Mycena epipterygia]|nr:hypothetical protein C8R44DRAFT_198286 [Mycena epipterygia]